MELSRRPFVIGFGSTLIEDKTSTKDHDEQLSRYYNHAIEGSTQIGEVAKGHLYPIHLKTGNQPRVVDRRIGNRKLQLQGVQSCGLSERDNGYEGGNPIRVDSGQHLQRLENETNSNAEWTQEDERECRRAWGNLPSPASTQTVLASAFGVVRSQQMPRRCDPPLAYCAGRNPVSLTLALPPVFRERHHDDAPIVVHRDRAHEKPDRGEPVILVLHRPPKCA